MKMVYCMINWMALVLCLGMMSSCATVKTQNIELSDFDYELVVDAEQMMIDELGNFYLINELNEIIRYNQQFQLLYKYSNNRLGAIASLDVSNPHKILVYYSDYGVAITLDNTLNETKRYDLQSWNLYDVTAVALSEDNRLWIYDPIQYQLNKVGEDGTVIFESYNLVSEIGINPDVDQIMEDNQMIYLLDDQKIYVFSNLGEYLSTKHLDNAKKLKLLAGAKVMFFENDQINIQNIGRNPGTVIFPQIGMVKDLSIHGKKVYVLDEKGIRVLNY